MTPPTLIGKAPTRELFPFISPPLCIRLCQNYFPLKNAPCPGNCQRIALFLTASVRPSLVHANYGLAMRTRVLTSLLCCTICAIPACGRKVVFSGSGGGSTITQTMGASVPATGTTGELNNLNRVIPSVPASNSGAISSAPPRRKALLFLSSDSLNTSVYSPQVRPKVEKARKLLLQAEMMEHGKRDFRNKWGSLALGGLIGFLAVGSYYLFNLPDFGVIRVFQFLAFFAALIGFVVYLLKTLVNPVFFRRRAARLLCIAPRSSKGDNFFSDSVNSLFALRDYLPAGKLKRRLKRIKYFQEMHTDGSNSLQKNQPAVFNKLAILEDYAAERLKKEKWRMALRTLKHVGIFLLILVILIGFSIGTMGEMSLSMSF